MASVTSLDKDLRKMRLDKYTPAAASEARSWIEGIVGEKLPSADLLEGLKDGVALCKLVNLTLQPPGVKFKQSAMPFVQMENISHFLRACQGPPLNLHQHDMFLTVDLYEQKDPAQVLQCLGAFSRAAHAVDSTTFPTTIGPRSRPGALSPQVTGSMSPTGIRNRGTSLTSNASSAYGGSRPILRQQTGDSVPGRWSPNRGHTKSPSNGGSPTLVTSWSRKEQETATAPAWNIAQYGYMGGASQGNLGISFGGRRQITGAGPRVPSLAEKERRRKEAGERQRQEAEERRRAEVEAEEQRWAEETERLREAERRKAEEEKQQWEEQERQWQLTEQKRRQEDQAAQARLEEERRRVRSRSDNKLRGQYLSQYKAEQDRAESSPRSRVRELEKELELARQREAEYKRERQQLAQPARNLSEKDARPETTRTRSGSWSKSDCEHLQTMQPARGQETAVEEEPTADAALPFDPPSPVTPRRPLPNPAAAAAAAVTVVPETSTSTSSRPLPDPARCGSLPAMATGRKNGLSANSQLAPQRTLLSREASAMAQSQSLTRAGGLASKSLLEREMELERQRQREWEEAQKETAKAVRPADGAVAGIGGGIGGRWDVGQWAGFTGGDSQNRGSQGIGAGRRPIVGPRPLPEPNR